MTDPKSKKKKPLKDETLQRTDYVRVGDVLRQAREERGLSVENVSAHIHIRAAQLRAIEEGNIDALPGITYATGFVRSYANFLKMDAVEIVARFKSENAGAASARPELNFPEPLAEDKMPSILMIGLGAFCAIVVLVAWAMFSGGGSDDKTAAQIPPAPVEAQAPAASTPVIPSEASALVANMAPTAPADAVAVAAAAAADAGASPNTLVIPDAPAANTAPQTATATAPAVTPVEDVSSAINGAAKPATPAAVAPAAPAAPVPAVAAAAPAPADTAAEQINIAPAKSRITLKSTQTSWMQVVDAQRRVIYKRVLRQGEQYAVPDQKGLSIMASNGGGIDVYVDGKRAAPLGTPGQIIRGMPLDPDNLKRRVVRNVRDY